MNIVLTGASGGIGYYTALSFLKEESNHVFVISRDEGKLALLRKESEESHYKGKLNVFVGDLKVDKDLINFKILIEKEVRSVDILINNAGELVHKPFDAIEQSEWKEIYGTNVFGVVAMIRALLPLLDAAKTKSNGIRAHIVNIGSIGGIGGTIKFAGLSAYSSSKGAISILTECLAEEFKPRKIAVNCLALGSVNTDMFSKAFPGMHAASEVRQIANYIAEFAENGHIFYNGKNLQVSHSTP